MLQQHGHRLLFGGVKACQSIMSNSHHTLWSIWIYLPALQRMFCLILCLVSIYILFSATIIIVCAGSLAKRQIADISSLQRSPTALHARCANLRQLIGATFYLFGFVYFVTLPFAFISLGDRRPGWMPILENLSIYFIFAANIFFILLLLHSVQWFATGRVHTAALRLNTPTSHL
jgi:hypothetical protein